MMYILLSKGGSRHRAQHWHREEGILLQIFERRGKLRFFHSGNFYINKDHP